MALRVYPRIRAGAAGLLGLLLVAASPALADSDSAFGAKPWLLDPPPARPSAAEAQRGDTYRLKLQGELRALELEGRPKSLRGHDRLKSFRQERMRIRDALRPSALD